MRTRTINRVARVKRLGTGGGTVPFNPVTFWGANLVAWWDFSNIGTLSTDNAGATPVTADGDLIGRAADLSGAGAHITRAANANRPAYRTNIQNGLSCAEFDGSDDYLRNTTFAVAQPYTVFLVARKTSATTVNGMIVDSNAAVQAAVYVGDHPSTTPSRFRGSNGVAPFDTSPTNPLTSWTQGTYQANGAASLIRVNGGSQATGSPGTNGLSGVRIGQIRNDIVGGYFWTGYVGEVILVNVAASAGQIQTTEAGLKLKWGTP